MQDLLKRLLLIFMMLALPLQAFASVAMQGYVFTDLQPESPAAMGPADMANCHSESVPDMGDTSAKDSYCNHCSACYLTAAFPIPIPAVALMAPIPYTPHLRLVQSVSGFIPEGPERPPRTTLA